MLTREQVDVQLLPDRYPRYVKSISSLLIPSTALLIWMVVGSCQAKAADCAALAGLKLPDTTITSATIISAAGPLPEYCKVLGQIHNLPQSTILFEISMPTAKWNHKYFVAGGGGYNGVIPVLNQALAEGYAAAGSDTGHVLKGTDQSWALNNLDAQNNYGYLATHVVTLLGKEVLRVFYGQQERRSYFVGCSNGGKMALMEVQRYPNDFDGVISGDPVIDRTKLMMSYVWNGKALAAAPIPPTKIPVIEKATLEACRVGGGIIAGLIMTPGRCKFDPRTIMCSTGDGPNCLTPGQVQSLQKILHGPTNSAGLKLYPGFLPGHEDDYPTFISGDETGDSQSAKNSDTLMRYFIFGPEFDAVKQFNFDTSLAALVPLAGAQDADSPDLSAFKAHGGKLIMYHGWADHSITPVRTIQYYAEVIDMMAKDHADDPSSDENADQVTDFFRLFMVPGMHHCGKGPGTNSFGGPNQGIPPQLDAQHDVVMALDRWVEDGVAPEKIIASHLTSGAVDRSLPLCPYPQTPIFNGSGNMNKSENYHCEQRGYWWAIESAEIGKRGSGAVSRSRSK